VKPLKRADARRYQRAAETFEPSPASYAMPSSRSRDFLREEVRAVEPPALHRDKDKMWSPQEEEPGPSRRLTRSAAKRYRDVERTFTSAPYDPPLSGPPDHPQEEARAVVPSEVKEPEKPRRPLTRAAIERYRRVAQALESLELHRGKSIKRSYEEQESAQYRPVKRAYFGRPVKRADAERYQAAAETFESSPASYDTRSSGPLDLLREEARAVVPKEKQYTTDKNRFITKKSMYDMLDHEIIKDLSDPTTRTNVKNFFTFNMKRKYGDKVSILSIDQPIGNCHTYTFTRNREGWLSGDDVEVILADNGYRAIATAKEMYVAPQKGDIVIYRWKDPQDSTGKIMHSGVFSRREGNEFYVTSRNGQYDETEHTIAFNELYGEWTIYRTDRPNGRFID